LKEIKLERSEVSYPVGGSYLVGLTIENVQERQKVRQSRGLKNPENLDFVIALIRMKA
jgi:hypothetical protein